MIVMVAIQFSVSSRNKTSDAADLSPNVGYYDAVSCLVLAIAST